MDSAVRPRVIKTYYYNGPDDSPAYAVDRYEPKDFRQRHFDGTTWHNGLGPYKDNPLPYCLRAVLRATQDGWIIVIVEGEKDADNLNRAFARAGIKAIATCNNGGAGKWGAAQSAYLTGATVCLIPDNDEAGQKHKVKTTQHLRAANVGSIRVIDLPTEYNGTPIKDVSDYLAAGGMASDLITLYESAPEYIPPAADLPQRPTIQKRRPIGDYERDRLSSWAIAALNGIYSALATLSDGRFAALKAAANRLGTISAHGLLTEPECINTLITACQANGYIGKHAQRTVESQIVHYFRSGLPHPCELPKAENEATANPNPDVPAADLPKEWPSTWPDSFERQFNEFFGKAGPSINTVMRAVVEYAGREPFTISELAELSGLPRKKIDRAVNGYSLHRLWRRLQTEYTNHKVSEDIDSNQFLLQSASNTTASGRTAIRYQLPTLPEFIELFINEVVTPELERRANIRRATLAKMKHYKPESTPATVATVNARIDLLLSDQTRRADQAATDRIKFDLARIRRDLENLTCTPLPDLPNGKTWKQDYTAAVVLRYDLAHMGEQVGYKAAEKATGVSAATVYRTERKIGIKRDQQTALDYVDTPANLPDLAYNPARGGFPKKVTVIRPDSSSITFNYADESARPRIANLLQNHPGATAEIEYQQAGIIRAMTAEELATRDLSKAKSEDKPKQAGNRKQTTTRDVDYTRAWGLNTLVLLGYQDVIGGILFNGERVATRPFAALTNRQIGDLLEGKNLAVDNKSTRQGVNPADVSDTINIQVLAEKHGSLKTTEQRFAWYDTLTPEEFAALLHYENQPSPSPAVETPAHLRKSA